MISLKKITRAVNGLKTDRSTQVGQKSFLSMLIHQCLVPALDRNNSVPSLNKSARLMLILVILFVVLILQPREPDYRIKTIKGIIRIEITLADLFRLGTELFRSSAGTRHWWISIDKPLNQVRCLICIEVFCIFFEIEASQPPNSSFPVLFSKRMSQLRLQSLKK